MEGTGLEGDVAWTNPTLFCQRGLRRTGDSPVMWVWSTKGGLKLRGEGRTWRQGSISVGSWSFYTWCQDSTKTVDGYVLRKGTVWGREQYKDGKLNGTSRDRYQTMSSPPQEPSSINFHLLEYILQTPKPSRFWLKIKLVPVTCPSTQLAQFLLPLGLFDAPCTSHTISSSHCSLLQENSAIWNNWNFHLLLEAT